MRSRSLFLCLWLPLLTLGFASVHSGMDISTPEKSFESFVKVLQSGENELLEKVVTPTGMHSLIGEAGQKVHGSELVGLGKELALSDQEWLEITTDIYMLTALSGDKKHKLEFTKEEPGWMLYHWQVGGGADIHTD